MELETKRILCDPSESGVYIIPIRNLYISILNLWSEFVFLSQAGEITDKKLIRRYVSVFKEDLQRARDNGVAPIPSQELQEFMKEWNISSFYLGINRRKFHQVILYNFEADIVYSILMLNKPLMEGAG
jgi:hypothetical protein